MEIQLWEADYVPDQAPEFVDPHITVDYDDTRRVSEYYLFEVNPNHPVFREVKDKRDLARRILLRTGFKNPKYITTADKPQELIDCKYPPEFYEKRPFNPRGFGG